jgi:hypothetical protein
MNAPAEIRGAISDTVMGKGMNASMVGGFSRRQPQPPSPAGSTTVELVAPLTVDLSSSRRCRDDDKSTCHEVSGCRAATGC